jgi:transposase
MLEEREMDRPERWSAKRKSEIVLRLLRGEDLGELSREIEVPPPVIEEWRQAFLSGAEAGLKKRGGDPQERELVRTRAKLGETMMKLELAEMLLEKRGHVDDLRKLRKSDSL